MPHYPLTETKRLMTDYRVELDIYHGPLDLMLYLIKRDEIDIHNIPIAHITEQYVAHLHQMQRLDISLAGEFLVMAATLMEIKSAMILPRDEQDQAAEAMAADVENPTDPRYELVQQLLAYKKYKDAARQLEQRRLEFDACYPHRAASFEAEAETTIELDIEDVTVWDLCKAFERLLEQVGDLRSTHDIISDDTPLELHAEDIMDRLHRDGDMTLQAMFIGRGSKPECLGLFLALLELLRYQKVRFKQDKLNGDIAICRRPESDWFSLDQVEPETAPPAHDPNCPDDFDWPDELTLKKYRRRIERRLRGEQIEEDVELAEDIEAIDTAPGIPSPGSSAPESSTPGSSAPETTPETPESPAPESSTS